MSSWFRKDLTCRGAVLFRGPLGPRREELDGLAAAGLEVERLQPGPDCEWELRVRHAQWGEADIFCPRDAPLPPKELIEWDPRLTHDVLRDRKVLLRFLHAALGSHGLFAMDHLAQSVDLLSDWMIMSPFGSITPAFGMALREVRSRPDDLRRIMAEMNRLDGQEPA